MTREGNETVKILLLCYEYPPLGGGGGVGAQQYAEAWARNGHMVTVLTGRARGLEFRERINNVDIIRVPTLGRGGRATASLLSMLSYLVFGSLYVLLHMRDFAAKKIVNTHFAVPTGPLGVLASKALRIPNVLTIIGGDIYDPSKKTSPHRNRIMRCINAVIINSSTTVVAISSDTKRRAEMHYRIKKEIKIINYGFVPVDLPTTSGNHLARENGYYYLIGVGRLVKRKGFEYLVRCLNLLPPTIRLIIVGDGPLETYLRDLADKNRVEDRVIFTGYLRRHEIYEYLQEADCFVLPSLHEGLGIVVQEAMYAGLPVVCSDEGGQVDLIRNGRNGILVKPADVRMLADAILTIYENEELADEMGNHNREDIKKYYMSANCEEYIDLFEDVLKESKSDRVRVKEARTPPADEVCSGRG